MKRITKKAMIILGTSCLMTGTILGATVGTKITAQLVQMKIIKDNQQVLKNTNVISYNGSTYVPLRAFSEVTGVGVQYVNGTIYLGNNNTISQSSSSSTSNIIYSDAIIASYMKTARSMVNNTMVYKTTNFTDEKFSSEGDIARVSGRVKYLSHDVQYKDHPYLVEFDNKNEIMTVYINGKQVYKTPNK